jgi:hypothetical protein
MKTICFICLASLLGLTSCSKQNPLVATTLNERAALAAGLPSNPMQFGVITSAVDKRDSTMWTLFGNELAVKYARSSSGHDYPAGSTLSLVAWEQLEDGRWFGGRIPGPPLSVEFVTVSMDADHRLSYCYQKFEGSPLKKVSAQEGPTPDDRTAHLLSQRAAVMP